jgi:Xaa-Pro dipeptidase
MPLQTEGSDTLDALRYPRFSTDELDRRRAELFRLLDEADLTAAVLYGVHWNGSAIPWLTEWPVTREAAVVVSRDHEDVLFVQHHNHLPQARELARRAEARWGGPSTIESVLAELGRRTPAGRVGWIGPRESAHDGRLTAAGWTAVELSPAYTRLRLRKSAEELEWMRLGASLSDDAVEAMVTHVRPGMTEPEIADVIERAYVPQGATTVIHHIGITSMEASDSAVPRQHRTGRRLRSGDALTVEISAAWWGYPGQVLRTFAVDAEPTPLFRRLHEVADEAYDAVTAALRPGATAADLVAASGVIEDAGFTIIDDLVHGFGGGYLPPVLGSRSRPAGPIPDLVFEPGMTVVVQPNVTTTDWTAGVQTGELVVVTDDGAQSLHRIPRGFLRLGA